MEYSKMERWQEIINYLNMSADWIQVIFTAFGLWLAARYMRQHARKVRLEKSYDLLHNCMLKIARHCADNHLFYKKVSAPKLRWLLGEITAVEAVSEIKKNFETQFQQLNESTISTFEIDAEIKLISNKSIQSLWEQLFENMASVGTHFEKINSVEEDEESCIDVLYDTPFGLFGDEHELKIEFSQTYSKLMASLLTFYRRQEEELDSLPKLNFFRISKN